MNKEDIIRMAREAADPELADPFQNGFCVLTQEELERFFQAAYAAGAAHEREACAKLCGDLHLEGEDDTGLAADLIIARGETK